MNTWNDQGKMITNDTALCGPMNADGSNYNTAIVGNYTVDFIRSVPHDKPFFVFAAPHAPHVGQYGQGGAGVTTTPAKWYNRSDDCILGPFCTPLFMISSYTVYIHIHARTLMPQSRLRMRIFNCTFVSV